MVKASQNLVGPQLKQARAAFHPALTQEALSKRLERFGVRIDRAGIAKIETGIRSVLDFEVVAFAKALNVRVAWLLGVKE